MVQLLMCLLAFTFVTGCAQTGPGRQSNPSQADPSAVAAPGINESLLVLHSKGGYFEQFTHPMTADSKYTVDLTLVRTNPNPVWHATAGVCVLTKTLQETCLRLTASHEQKFETELSVLVAQGEDKKSLGKLPGSFRLGVPVRIRLHRTEDGFIFGYDDNAQIPMRTDGEVESMRLGCSSSLCSIKFVETDPD